MLELPKNIFDRTTWSEDLTNSIAKRHFDMQEKTRSRMNCLRVFLMGWEMGFEPTIFGTTIRRFNQLSYTHHKLPFSAEEHWRALLDSNQWLTA